MPYTALDIGWWYQLILPRLPSGRIDGFLAVRSEAMVGDGRTPLALTDMRDVGRFVARVIADPRTLSKSVFAHGEERTQASVWELLEEVSGEEIPREYVSFLSSM